MPAWWPDGVAGWELAVARTGLRDRVAEVEFDGLVVACDLRGGVVRAVVLDPAGGRARPPVDRRRGLGIILTLILAVVASELSRLAFHVFVPIALVWVLSAGYLGLRDERPSRALAASDAADAVARHAAARRLAEARATALLHRDLPARSHAILWELACSAGPDEAEHARRRHVALLGDAGAHPD